MHALTEQLADLQEATTDLEYSGALLDAVESILMDPQFGIDGTLLESLRAAVSNANDRIAAVRNAVDAVSAAAQEALSSPPHLSTIGPADKHAGL